MEKWFTVISYGGALYIGWGLLVAYVVVGCVVVGIGWHVRGEDAYWVRQANDLTVLFGVHPVLALLLAVAVAVALVALLAVCVVGWPSVAAVAAVRFLRRRARRAGDT